MRSLNRQLDAVGSELELGRTVVVTPPSLVWIGYICAGFLFLLSVVCVAAKDGVEISMGDLWFAVSVLCLPAALFNLLFARHTHLEIGPGGIRIVNPLNVAYLPWREIEEIDEDSIGRLRIKTARWSASSWAVCASTWDAWFDRTGCVERVAEIFDEHMRRGPDQSDGGAESAWRRWRIPLGPFVGYVGAVLLSGFAIFVL